MIRKMILQGLAASVMVAVLAFAYAASAHQAPKISLAWEDAR